MMVIVAVHLVSTEQSDQPASRKRIRIANGWVMLIVIPLLAAGFSLIDHQTSPRGFVLTWLGATGLLLVTVILALADIFNSIRIARISRKRLRDAATMLRVEIERADRRGERQAEDGNERL